MKIPVRAISTSFTFLSPRVPGLRLQISEPQKAFICWLTMEGNREEKEKALGSRESVGQSVAEELTGPPRVDTCLEGQRQDQMADKHYCFLGFMSFFVMDICRFGLFWRQNVEQKSHLGCFVPPHPGRPIESCLVLGPRTNNDPHSPPW